MSPPNKTTVAGCSPGLGGGGVVWVWVWVWGVCVGVGTGELEEGSSAERTTTRPLEKARKVVDATGIWYMRLGYFATNRRESPESS